MQQFGRSRYGQKISGLCLFRGGRAGSPPNTMWPGPRPICMPSFILIHPTVWPQCTNVTDRTDRTDRQTGQNRQRTDSIGRTILQTVAQKLVPCGTDGRLLLSGFQVLVTLTLTLDRVIRHTVVHRSSTSVRIPSLIEIGKNVFCGRTNRRDPPSSRSCDTKLGQISKIRPDQI